MAYMGKWEGVLKVNAWNFIAFLMALESDQQLDIEKAKGMRLEGEIEKSIVKGYDAEFKFSAT
jgi:hypothetical protein